MIELFDQKLIQEFGMYQPSNSKFPNLNGLVFDHLYRVYDGFLNNIDPLIIKHPANAELIPQPLNKERMPKSTITIEELYERIRLWDSGNRNLKKYYLK